MATHTDDLAFVEKVVNGDREAAELFLYRCQLWAGQLARWSRVPEQEWGDLAQEALLTALGQMRRGLFRGDSSFQTWVEKIIRGKIADYWRRHKNDQALAPLEAPLGDHHETVARSVALIQSLALRKVDHELRLAVQQALRALPEQHAVVLLLNVREGYSTAEIGQWLDLPQGTVGRKLFEAKRLFRQFFGAAPETRWQSKAEQSAEREAEIRPRPGGRMDVLRNSILSWLIPTRRWPEPAGVQRRNFTLPSPIIVSATPMSTSGAWSKSI